MNFCGQCGLPLTGRFCGSCGWGPAPEAGAGAEATTALPAEGSADPWSSPADGSAGDVTAPLPVGGQWDPEPVGADGYPEQAQEVPWHDDYTEHGEAVAATSRPRRGPGGALLAFLLVLLLAGLGAAAHTLGWTDGILGGDDVAAPAETTGSEEETAGETDPTEEPTDQATAEPTDEPSEEPTDEPTEEETEQFPTPITDPYSAVIEYGGEGTACETDNHVPSPYGNYAYASCRTWQDTTGLNGHALTKGDLNAVCQSHLGHENPVFTPGQENTWWFWAESDSGEYDWFPHTALSQGATMQPVSGIPHCEF